MVGGTRGRARRSVAAKVTGIPRDIQAEEFDKVMPMMSRDMRFDPQALDVLIETYERVLAEAQKNPDLKNVQVTNTAKTRAPDSYPSLQKILQHISWAPVIVDLTWRE